MPSLQQNFTHNSHVVLQAFSLFTLPLIRRTACARAQFSRCSSTTNAHNETGQMADYCEDLTLGALSSRSALSLLVGALFKKFSLFLNTPCIYLYLYWAFRISTQIFQSHICAIVDKFHYNSFRI